MIEIKDISKKFSDLTAVDHISATIIEGHVFGLIGTNGAGKSTFMRMLTGVLKPDQGEILIDGSPVYDNEEAKSKLFYISDSHYYFKNGTPFDMARFYSTCYKAFDMEKWKYLCSKFGLDYHRKIATFSKGMKKQVSVITGICANTKYLLCDETFDGLDPVMRQAVKQLFIREIDERGLTPIIASHNLRELEDICEYVGLLHKGGILFEKDLEELKWNIHKIQCVIKDEEKLEFMKKTFDIVTMDKRGFLYTLTVRGEKQIILERLEQQNHIFYELLPLSLEEIFISETEVKGYDIKALLY